jgi:hypothetical protein
MLSVRRIVLLVAMLCLLIPLVAWAMTKADCTKQYDACCILCRGMADPRLRTACWPACMTVYAGCLAVAK